MSIFSSHCFRCSFPLRAAVGLCSLFVLWTGRSQANAQTAKHAPLFQSGLPSIRLASETGADEASSLLTGRGSATVSRRGALPVSPLGLLPFQASLRLGAILSPRTGLAVGADVTIPMLHLLPGFTSRVSGDAIITITNSGDHGFFGYDATSIYPLTFDQVYSKGIVTGQKIYAGFGVGPYFGKITRFGGKLFVGANIIGGLGAEGALHFAGSGDPLLTVQLRYGL